MNRILIKISAMFISISGLILPGKPVLALTYSDFSESVSSQIGQGSSMTANLLTLAAAALLCIVAYIVYKINAKKQTKAVDEAYRRNLERRQRPPKTVTKMSRNSKKKY